MPFLANSSWEEWKKALGQAVEFAQDMGVSGEQLVGIARQAGDFLAHNVPPANPEQKAVKELWEVADDGEKNVLAHLMTKLAARRSGYFGG